MHIRVTVTLALFLGLIKTQDTRDLQALPPVATTVNTAVPLRYYGESYNITYAATLGCGACINAGYTYCIQGKEGDDFTGKTLTTIQKCCPAGATAATCPEIAKADWTCSNTYTDRTLAKTLCPWRQTACGPKQNYDYLFYGSLSKDNVTLSLGPGETCSYALKTTCGVPTYKPYTTAGFDIESVDYASDEVARLRFLQALPPPTPTPTPTTTPATTTPAPSTAVWKKLDKKMNLPRRTITL